MYFNNKKTTTRATTNRKERTYNFSVAQKDKKLVELLFVSVYVIFYFCVLVATNTYT